jgi:hypothetical protein
MTQTIESIIAQIDAGQFGSLQAIELLNALVADIKAAHDAEIAHIRTVRNNSAEDMRAEIRSLHEQLATEESRTRDLAAMAAMEGLIAAGSTGVVEATVGKAFTYADAFMVRRK